MALKNIETERIKKGISKKQLASDIGVSIKTYYNWINETSPIPSTALIKIANLFGTSVDYLLGHIEQENPRKEEHNE